MSGQALCKYCSSVGSSCFCYMRWLISLYQSLHCFWSIFCVLVPSPLNTNWSLLDSVSSVWGWGSWSCYAFPRSSPACGLVPTCRMKKRWLEAYGVKTRPLICFIQEQFPCCICSVFFWMNVDRNHGFVIYCCCLPLWVLCTAYLPQKCDA